MIKTENLFGTDGIRTRFGTFPLTIQALSTLGNAIALWILEKYDRSDFDEIIISYDTRKSSQIIKNALSIGLLSNNITVIDTGVLPTPVLYHTITKNEAKLWPCGIMITASHNPEYDNGIKIFDLRMGKITPADEERITQLFFQQQQQPSWNYEQLGTEEYDNIFETMYKNDLLKKFKPKFLRGKKIILDCANGATRTLAPNIFEECGAKVITIYDDFNGINQDCGSQYPQALQKKVLQEKAYAGFAFDGDGDRIIAVSNKGEIKDGDAILALLSEHPYYEKHHSIVGTVMSNQGLDHFLKTKQKKLLRSTVGDKYVAKILQENNLVLGGEPSGHIIMTDHLTAGDGIFAALRILEAIDYTGNHTMETFKPFPSRLINVRVKQKRDLTSEPLANIIAATQTQLSHGRLIVRYSGTENLLRIFVEDQDSILVENLSNELAKNIQDALE